MGRKSPHLTSGKPLGVCTGVVLMGKSSLAGKGRSDDHSIPGHLADGGMGGQAEDGTLSTVTSFTSRQRIVDGNPGLEAHAGRKADKEGATMLGKQDPQSLSQG